MECNICLYGLFITENQKYNQLTEDFAFDKPEEERGINQFCKKFKEAVLDFHEYNFSLNKKPFMITPCKHIFHTNCLESWFRQKKECPNCRQEIEDLHQ
jgi:hypothetical protein